MRVISGLALALLALGTATAAAQTADATCRIGKPSYCYKYGGSLCQTRNSRGLGSGVCDSWTSACLECHAEIPACLGAGRPGFHRPLRSTSVCSRCDARWTACMAKTDRRFWPNRRALAN
jgi:hypothetical protein